ncbi:MAG: 6-phosphogluconate dehydrogenase [Bacteroidota bacterium]
MSEADQTKEVLNKEAGAGEEPSMVDKAKKSVKGFFKKLLLWTLLVGIVGGGIFLSIARFASYSNGERSGKVVKFSRKGVVFKTHEGEMNTGDYAAGQWKFSVYPGDDEIQDEIKDAMENGSEVKVKYKERYFDILFWGDTRYFIYDVDVIRE